MHDLISIIRIKKPSRLLFLYLTNILKKEWMCTCLRGSMGAEMIPTLAKQTENGGENLDVKEQARKRAEYRSQRHRNREAVRDVIKDSRETLFKKRMRFQPVMRKEEKPNLRLLQSVNP